jgi:hypothetical protein
MADVTQVATVEELLADAPIWHRRAGATRSRPTEVAAR